MRLQCLSVIVVPQYGVVARVFCPAGAEMTHWWG
jgi:hypothetical protein